MILNVEPVARLNLFGPLPGATSRKAMMSRVVLPLAFSATTLYATVVVPVLRHVTNATRLLSHSTLPPLVTIIFLIWATSLWGSRRNTTTAVNILIVGGTYVLAMLLLARFMTTYESTTWVSNLARTLLVLPLSAAAGWALMTSGRISRYLSWLLVTAIVTVVPAIYEYARHVSLFHASATQRNGDLRAVVGADQPLVLGTLFAAMIPIAVWLCGRWGIAVGAWLLFGTFLTGSSGPELVGGIVLAISALAPLGQLLLTRWEPLVAALVAIVAFIAYGSAYLWTTQLNETSVAGISHAYRGALYHVLPQILAERPFGYGPGGLPNGVWFVESPLGPFDLGRSLDSEVVYASAQFGYPAIAVLVLIVMIAIFASTRHNAIGLTTLSVTMVGFFLAVHSWFSLASFWFVCIGACAALIWAPGTQRWSGLRSTRSVAAPPAAVRERILNV